MKKNEKLLNTMGNINDNLIHEAENAGPKRNITKYFIAPIAACLALTVVLGAGHMVGNRNSLPQGGEMESVLDTSPMEARKFLNYNGFRYAYDNNLIPEQYIKLGKELGEITADLSVDPEGLAAKNLAGTFAPGSKIYALEGYETEFRIAVTDEFGVYVCQVTDSLGGKGLDLSEFFDETELESMIEEISVFDHFRSNFLMTLEENQTEELLELVSEAKKAVLKSEDYEKIAALQTQGGSFSIECSLSDGTLYQFYAIPAMGLVMVGDNTYALSEDAKEELMEILEDLK